MCCLYAQVTKKDHKSFYRKYLVCVQLVQIKPPGRAPTVEVKKTQWPTAVLQFPRLLPRQSRDAVSELSEKFRLLQQRTKKAERSEKRRCERSCFSRRPHAATRSVLTENH